MHSNAVRPLPPDQADRLRALDPARSVLVQAPAGSGKTDLLTRRFLRLLATVDDPGEIVAITFTIDAAAEMRQRILSELEKAAVLSAPPLVLVEELSASSTPVIPSDPCAAKEGKKFAVASGEYPGHHELDSNDDFAVSALAHRALLHSQARGWNLLDLPSQLRISTIDAFCRELALQQPLLSGLGGGLDIAEQEQELYRRAARQTLDQIGSAREPALSAAIESLLLWRDNSWSEMEDLLVEMLCNRDRWMHDFLLERDPDWERLRARLERPFANAVREALTRLSLMLDRLPRVREEILSLARFACSQTENPIPRAVAELAEIPCSPFATNEELEDAHQAFGCLADLLLTGGSALRKAVDKRLGFPADRKVEKARLLALIASLAAVPGLEATLAEVRSLPPARYTEEEWSIVRACFTVLRRAAAQLKLVFAESGAVDFIEVAQIAQAVLKTPDGFPSDAAIKLADGIRHLLVDEFQDTSRRQHQLLSGLIAAWPSLEGRTCFLVGDPMQSIYFFRDADAELFPRVRDLGLEIPAPDAAGHEALRFEFVALEANFRTAPALVERLNQVFTHVFAEGEGDGIQFFAAEPAREPMTLVDATPRFSFHVDFLEQASSAGSGDSSAQREQDEAAQRNEETQPAQVQEIVDLILSYAPQMREARAARAYDPEAKFRIAILARTKKSLVPIAQALRRHKLDSLQNESEKIPFRAIELEKLRDRPEVLDVLALARALLNPHDRVAWLGVLRAPWCGLPLADLHCVAGNPEEAGRTIPSLLSERLPALSAESQPAAARVLRAFASARELRAEQPTQAVGTWLRQVWRMLGGDCCVDAAARANLDLLWACFDRLGQGEADLLGPALDAALERLTALPDPDADGDIGVQLMTIHKSKGLEFEVVIVPDLQAREGRPRRTLLSWLERGLPAPAEDAAASGGDEEPLEITEFLVAPIQAKGDNRGTAKAWVDRVRCDREAQEARRILYVAATRAREELHLFARLACKTDSGGSLALAEPSKCLLATAWPVFEAEIRGRFEAWKLAQQAAQPARDVNQQIEALAASAESISPFPIAPSLPAKATLLRRLPSNFAPAQFSKMVRDADRLVDGAAGHPSFDAPESSRGAQPAISRPSSSSFYARHEGGQVSRSLGIAVHALLQQLAGLRANADLPQALAELERFLPAAAAQIRAAGIAPAQASHLAGQALSIAAAVAKSAPGQWILAPHPGAASESRWTGAVDGALRTIQIDRVFRAGLFPESTGEDAWWVVDFKTAYAEEPVSEGAELLARLRPMFAPQLEMYGRVLRNLHGPDAALRAGLFYPRMLLFDWWQM